MKFILGNPHDGLYKNFIYNDKNYNFANIHVGSYEYYK